MGAELTSESAFIAEGVTGCMEQLEKYIDRACYHLEDSGPETLFTLRDNFISMLEECIDKNINITCMSDEGKEFFVIMSPLPRKEGVSLH